MRDVLNTPILFLLFVALAVLAIQWLLFIGANKTGNKTLVTFTAGPGGRINGS